MKNLLIAALLCTSLGACAQSSPKCRIASFSMLSTPMFVTSTGDINCLGTKNGGCAVRIFYDRKGRVIKSQTAAKEFAFIYAGELLVKQTRAPLNPGNAVPEETRTFTYKDNMLVRTDVANAGGEKISYFIYEYPGKQQEIRSKFEGGKLTEKLETKYSAFENPLYNLISAAAGPWDVNSRMIPLELKYSKPASPNVVILTYNRSGNTDGSTASFEVVEAGRKPITFEIQYDCSEPTAAATPAAESVPVFTWFEDELEKARLNRAKHKTKSQRTFDYVMDRGDAENGPGKLENEEFYNEEGRIIKDVKYGGRQISRRSFDAQGLETQVIVKDANENLLMMKRNEYDGNRRLVKSTQFNQEGAVAGVTKTRYFSYGSETVSYGANDAVILTSRTEYNPAGKTYTSTTSLSPGKIMMSEEYVFDESGAKTGWSIGKGTKGTVYTGKFKLDARGNEIEKLVFTEGGELKKRHVYEYDNNNFLVKWSIFDPAGVKERVTKYVYE